jgi:1-acyl-sn-glycerol-3-phosphate acyltransferase
VRLLPRPEGESLVSWYGFGVTVLWPPLQVMTKRDWRGTEHLGQPGEGRILAANHISWFDPFVLCHFINDNGRSVRILAKASLFDVPFGGAVLRGTQQIPVHRNTGDAAAAVDAAVEAVESGECLLLYPEGTITRDPDLWPMTGKTGAARIALRTRKPVIPVAQWGAQEVMGPYQLQARVLPRKTMRVAAGPPVELSDLYGEEPTPEVLEVATNRIMDAITEQLAGLREEDPPRDRWNMKARARERRGPVVLRAGGGSPQGR